jgi:hypothetical protein
MVALDGQDKAALSGCGFNEHSLELSEYSVPLERRKENLKLYIIALAQVPAFISNQIALIAGAAVAADKNLVGPRRIAKSVFLREE